MSKWWIIRMFGFPVLFPVFAIIAGLRLFSTKVGTDAGELLLFPLTLPMAIFEAGSTLLFWEYFVFNFTLSNYISKCIQPEYDWREEKAEKAYAKEEKERIHNSTCAWCGRSFTGQAVQKLFGKVHCSKKCQAESGL